MKTTLLCSAALLALNPLLAQVVADENFDSYTVGNGIAVDGAAAGWYIWNPSNPAFDAVVSDEQALSGTQSLKIDQSSTDDVVWAADEPITDGLVEVSFAMYIPTGQEGYFNLMQSWDPVATNQYLWAVDVFFGGGIIFPIAESVEGPPGSFNHDEWFQMKVTIDFAADLGQLYHNDVLLHQWQWSLENGGGNPGLSAFEVVNFFGYGPSEMNGLYYIDDFRVEHTSTTSIAEESTANVQVYPNPANQIVTIDLSNFGQADVSVFDLGGRMVLRQESLSNNRTFIDVTPLTPGVYFVDVTNGSHHHRQRLVVQ